MIAEASQADLATGVLTVARAIASRSPNSPYTGVLVSAEAGQLRLTATDGEMRIEHWIEANIREEGALVLPGRQFPDILRRARSATVRIETDTAASTATLSWERSETVLHGRPAGDFPIEDAAAAGAPVELDALALGALLRQTSFAASEEESRPVLTGVLFMLADGAATAVATDGFRLAFSSAPCPGLGGGAVRVVIPRRALAEVTRLLDDAPGGHASLAIGERRAVFQVGATVLRTSLIEGQFPNYEQVLPPSYSTRVEVARDELHAACDLAATLLRDGQGAVTLSIAPGVVAVSARSPEVGHVRQEVVADVSGGALDVAFNPRYLMDGLRATESDRVVLETTGPLSPARITTAGGGSFFYILLPLRPASS